MPFVIHSLIIDKATPLKEAKKFAKDILKKTKIPYRETSDTYHFENIPADMFNQKSFKSKVINDKITMVLGEIAKK
jgi:phosphoribosylamine-glycine ligase